jgi:uncharacterized protein DUF2851
MRSKFLAVNLTLQNTPRKSNVKVPRHLSNFYTQWRAQFGSSNVLRDENSLPSERLLQAIWQHQRLRRDQFKTADGKVIRVFHPGFASVEGGPDFRSAVLQIGDDAPLSGDVEIDRYVNGWHAHGHDRNPDFKNVVLHVVWEDAQPTTDVPTVLSLKNFLDAPIGELNLSLENESLRSLPENLRGKCSAPLRELGKMQLTELLCQAAFVRFQAKAGQFRTRAKNFGWEQTLWENLFRALGYKHNVWPMQNLAESRLRWARGASSTFEFQVRLLGVSGLLPDELPRAQKSSDTYLQRVWDCWWREREEFSDCILPRAVWKFHGLRPANHPQLRLALAAHWLASGKIVAKLEHWCATELPDKKLLDSLREIFQVESDEFWSWHRTFKSARLKKPLPLLGDARVTDLAVNVILPWLWIRAVEGKNKKIQRVIERRYFTWPAAEDNSVLKLARQRLLGTGQGRALCNAAAQQGLMQIVRDFCEHSNAVCENCQFPELVRGWKTKSESVPLISLQGLRTGC